MSEDVARRLYEDYEVAQLRIQLDERLTEQEKERAITHLTDELLEKERTAGIHWRVLASVEVVDASEGGSVELDLEE